MQLERLTGSEKAAILILALPEAMASTFLDELEDNEVEEVLQAVDRMQEVQPDLKDQVLMEFRDTIRRREDAITGGRERAVKLIEKHLDRTRGNRTLEIFSEAEKRIDWALRPYAPRFIAQNLSSEHPQTIALVVSQLEPDRGAEIVANLPEEVRSEVVLRVANLKSISRPMIRELVVGLERLFGRSPEGQQRVTGVETAAMVLNRVPKAEGQTILEGVDNADPTLGGEIRKRMLTFNDLVSLDSRGMQSLMREIPTEDLVVALKTATEEMRDKIFSNVSSRAAAQIKEDLELLPPMKLSEVESVQQQIVDVARRLQEDGVLTLDTGDSGDVIV